MLLSLQVQPANVCGLLEYGLRVPPQLDRQFTDLLSASRANPKLSHYLR